MTKQNKKKGGKSMFPQKGNVILQWKDENGKHLCIGGKGMIDASKNVNRDIIMTGTYIIINSPLPQKSKGK